MTRETLLEIFDDTESNWDGDNALQGLNILSKYSDKNRTVSGVGYDKIFSIDVGEALENGLSESDATQLARLNWMLDYEYDCFSCFV